MPEDFVFKGYENVIVQEIQIKTDNVGYKRDVFYSASKGKTYLGQLPAGVNGEFGPGVRSLVCTLKHVCPYYTAFFTVPHKNRLTILDILLCGKERTYIFDSKAFYLLSELKVSKKIIDRIVDLTDER